MKNEPPDDKGLPDDRLAIEPREECPSSLEQKVKRLVRWMKESRETLVYTGAGISTAASIPDYRGPYGVWTQARRGVEVPCFNIVKAAPTQTHLVLKELYREGLISHILSQNCDGLHLRSGIPQKALSEIHGNQHVEVCPQCKKHFVRPFDVTEERRTELTTTKAKTKQLIHTTTRECPKCAVPLRDTIVYCGEISKVRWPLNWKALDDKVPKAKLIVVIGTSCTILRKYATLWPDKEQNCRIVVINLQSTSVDKYADMKITVKCDKVMEKLKTAFELEISPYCRECDPVLCRRRTVRSTELMHRISDCTCNGSGNRSRNAGETPEDTEPELKKPGWWGVGLQLSNLLKKAFGVTRKRGRPRKIVNDEVTNTKAETSGSVEPLPETTENTDPALLNSDWNQPGPSTMPSCQPTRKRGRPRMNNQGDRTPPERQPTQGPSRGRPRGSGGKGSRGGTGGTPYTSQVVVKEEVVSDEESANNHGAGLSSGMPSSSRNMMSGNYASTSGTVGRRRAARRPRYGSVDDSEEERSSRKKDPTYRSSSKQRPAAARNTRQHSDNVHISLPYATPQKKNRGQNETEVSVLQGTEYGAGVFHFLNGEAFCRPRESLVDDDAVSESGSSSVTFLYETKAGEKVPIVETNTSASNAPVLAPVLAATPQSSVLPENDFTITFSPDSSPSPVPHSVISNIIRMANIPDEEQNADGHDDDVAVEVVEVPRDSLLSPLHLNANLSGSMSELRSPSSFTPHSIDSILGGKSENRSPCEEPMTTERSATSPTMERMECRTEELHRSSYAAPICVPEATQHVPQTAIVQRVVNQENIHSSTSAALSTSNVSNRSTSCRPESVQRVVKQDRVISSNAASLPVTESVQRVVKQEPVCVPESAALSSPNVPVPESAQRVVKQEPIGSPSAAAPLSTTRAPVTGNAQRVVKQEPSNIPNESALRAYHLVDMFEGALERAPVVVEPRPIVIVKNPKVVTNAGIPPTVSSRPSQTPSAPDLNTSPSSITGFGGPSVPIIPPPNINTVPIRPLSLNTASVPAQPTSIPQNRTRSLTSGQSGNAAPAMQTPSEQLIQLMNAQRSNSQQPQLAASMTQPSQPAPTLGATQQIFPVFASPAVPHSMAQNNPNSVPLLNLLMLMQRMTGPQLGPQAVGAQAEQPGGPRGLAVGRHAGQQAVGLYAGQQAVEPYAGQQAVGPYAGQQAVGPSDRRSMTRTPVRASVQPQSRMVPPGVSRGFVPAAAQPFAHHMPYARPPGVPPIVPRAPPMPQCQHPNCTGHPLQPMQLQPAMQPPLPLPPHRLMPDESVLSFVTLLMSMNGQPPPQ